MKNNQHKQIGGVVLISILPIVMLLINDVTRNILWLMTAAMCQAINSYELWTYRIIFGLQMAAIGISMFSIFWNIYEMTLKRLK